MKKKSKANNIWGTIPLIIICLFLIDVSKLKNTPDFIYYFSGSIIFIISNFAWIYYLRGTKWFLEIKSILLYLLAIMISSIPLTFGLIILFNAFIKYYDFENEIIIKEKCLVTHVSSGKNASLSYKFRGKIFQTKNYYYQDYKNCGYNKNECYIILTLKEKPFGMFYEINIDKWNDFDSNLK